MLKLLKNDVQDWTREMHTIKNIKLLKHLRAEKLGSNRQ